MKLIFFFFSAVTILIAANDDERNQHKITVERRTDQNIGFSQLLNMTLCADKCTGMDCKTYVTPINKCYSSSLLFPNDPSWSGKDFHDELVCETLVRTIFDTDNSTCRDATDTFEIPMNECVGPFGKPRPWGIFISIHQQEQGGTSGKDGSRFPSLCANSLAGRIAVNN